MAGTGGVGQYMAVLALTATAACPNVGDGNRIARGALLACLLMAAGRIGKPVQFRHGPATVFGESFDMVRPATAWQ